MKTKDNWGGLIHFWGENQFQTPPRRLGNLTRRREEETGDKPARTHNEKGQRNRYLNVVKGEKKSVSEKRRRTGKGKHGRT